MHSPLKKKLGRGGLVPKKFFTDVFDNTSNINYFKANIFFPKTTQNYLRNTMKQVCQDNCLLLVTN